MRNRKRSVLTLAVIATLSVLGMSVGCAATRARRSTPEVSGFLLDYSKLSKNPEYEAALVYVKPGVQWTLYDSIEIDSVGLWGDENTAKLSAEDRQRLTDVLFTVLSEELGKYFHLVEEPGPNSLRLRVAVTQARGANVPLRTLTTVIPQLRLGSSAVGLGTDTAATVGSATVEMELLDGVTDERLAASVDRRAGSKVLFAKRAYRTWGDVEAAARYWSRHLAWLLARGGVQRKPGTVMPEKPKEGRTF